MVLGGSGGNGAGQCTINIEFGGRGGTGPLPSAIRTGLLSGIDDSSGGSGGTGPEPSTINIEFGGSGGTGPLPSAIRTGVLSAIDDSSGASGGAGCAPTTIDSGDSPRGAPAFLRAADCTRRMIGSCGCNTSHG